MFDASHPLWGKDKTQIDWSSESFAVNGEKNTIRLGGYNEKCCFQVVVRKGEEPKLVIAPIEFNGESRSYQWEKGQERELLPADVGMLLTVLSENIERFKPNRGKVFQQIGTLDNTVRIFSQLSGNIPDEQATNALQKLQSNRLDLAQIAESQTSKNPLFDRKKLFEQMLATPPVSAEERIPIQADHVVPTMRASSFGIHPSQLNKPSEVERMLETAIKHARSKTSSSEYDVRHWVKRERQLSQQLNIPSVLSDHEVELLIHKANVRDLDKCLKYARVEHDSVGSAKNWLNWARELSVKLNVPFEISAAEEKNILLLAGLKELSKSMEFARNNSSPSSVRFWIDQANKIARQLGMNSPIFDEKQGQVLVLDASQKQMHAKLASLKQPKNQPDYWAAKAWDVLSDISNAFSSFTTNFDLTFKRRIRN